MDITLQPRQLDLVKIQPRQQAPMQLVNLLALRQLPLRRILLLHHHPLVAKHLHGLLHLLAQRHVGLRPLPHDVAMALDEVAAQAVNLHQAVLEVLLVLLDLVAQADGVLEAAHPVARVALLLVVHRREVVGEDDGRQEQRMADLGGAGLEVREGALNVGAGRALDEARGDVCLEVVGEHHLPSARLALFPHV